MAKGPKLLEEENVRFTTEFLQAGDDQYDRRDFRSITRRAPDPLEYELVKPLSYTQTRRRLRSLPKKLTHSLTIPEDFRADQQAQEILRTILDKVKLLRLAKQPPALARLAVPAA